MQNLHVESCVTNHARKHSVKSVGFKSRVWIKVYQCVTSNQRKIVARCRLCSTTGSTMHVKIESEMEI